MTHPDPVERVAGALLQARRSHEPADAAALEGLLPDAAAAYAVQDRVASASGWHPGGVARHWKSGGPQRDAVLTHAGLPEPGVWTSPADARSWPFRLRLIEAEVALRLREPVDARRAAALTHEAAAALVDAMAVAIEIVDSRWLQAVQAPALLKLADLQTHGALVLGAWQPFAPRDWAAQACTVDIGGTLHRFTGTHSLQDPAWLLPAWLRHATRHGGTVAAGTVVTTGTWCGILQAKPGDRVRVDFDGIGEAEVQL